MSNFTKEQLQELEVLYGLKLNSEVAEVLDGYVSKTDKVWWRYTTGSELVYCAVSHWDNILKYPKFYQINRPNYSVTYQD